MAWFARTSPDAGARVRLICLPYAGGTAAVYRDWAGALGTGVEVLPVQLPGRGWRLRETPSVDLKALAAGIAEAVEPLAEVPVAVFGHSMGAWLGFELVTQLEARGIRPVQLFASGRQAPWMGCEHEPLSVLDDAAFVAETQRRYDGIPAEVLAEPELLALVLPALRADVAALEGYRRETGTPVRTPIMALAGRTDGMIPVERLDGWAMETTGEFTSRLFEGGHFYFRPDPKPLLQVVREALAAAARPVLR